MISLPMGSCFSKKELKLQTGSLYGLICTFYKGALSAVGDMYELANKLVDDDDEEDEEEQAQQKAHEDEMAGITARHERIITLQERDHADRLALLHTEHAETKETATKQHEAAVAEQLQQLTKVR